MWKIHDPLLARMWYEKNLMVIAFSVAMLTIASAIDIVFLQQFYVSGICLICVLVLFGVHWEMRYRMHKGSYGQRPRESEDYDRWIEKRGGTKIVGMNLD